MNHLTMQEIWIIGISTRTINTNGQSAQDLEILWKRFWDQDIRHKIPHTISDDIYAVYTDYDTDFTGYYTTIIGLAVGSLEEVPEGMVGIKIQADQYEQIRSKGRMPEAIFNTWLEIWADEALHQRRAYRADFTVHGEKYFDGDQAEVETYLSIRS